MNQCPFKLIDQQTIPKLATRVMEVVSDIRQHGLKTIKNRECVTGYSYGEFYDWDLYFENIFLSYFGVHTYCRNGVEMFLDRQVECGFISRTLGLVWPKLRHHFKPFLAQTALLGCRQSKDFSWLAGNYYERLKKYMDYWFWFNDYDKNGLCVWDGSDHSGMDNHFDRLGWEDRMTVEGVDLNCYLVRELQAMAALASELGHMEDRKNFLQHADELANLINDVFWDETSGFYFDRDERKQNLVKTRSIAGFTPLWAGIAPPDRAARLVNEHLLNTEEFWLTYPVAAWAKNEVGYYQMSKRGECNWMGTTWIPTNYMIFHGLLDYGYTKVACELAEKTFNLVMSSPVTREYYNAETGEGQGCNPFWGWSSLAYFMPMEYECGYDPMKPAQTEIIPLAEKYLQLNFNSTKPQQQSLHSNASA